MSESTIKEKISNFYDVEIEGKSLRLNGRHIPASNHELILGFGKEKEDVVANKETYEKNGEIIITTGIELHRIFFNLSEEEACQKQYGYSTRTKKYLDACIKNTGLIESDNGWDGKDFEKLYGIKIWANLTGSGEVDCGKLGDNWIAQYSFQTAIDDYIIIWHVFNRKPTSKMINDIKTIEDIQIAFKLHKVSENFQCWECGCETHWLDVEGNLQEKWERLQDCYCGC